MEVTADEEGGGKDSSSASTTARKRRRRLGAGRGSESPLYEVVCPAVYVIRVFGLAPYAYPKDNRPPRLSPSAFNCVFSLFWMTLYTYIVVGTMRRFNGLNKEKPILGATENGKVRVCRRAWAYFPIVRLSGLSAPELSRRGSLCANGS